MFRLIKRSICTVLVILLFNCVFIISAKATSVQGNNIIVKPAFLDLGNVENNPISFTATVTNNDEPNTFKGNVEGKSKEFINFQPESFSLGKGESKEVKIQINDISKLTVGPYDDSIRFLTMDNDKDWVSTRTSNSIRLKFIKEGIDVASIRVTDINKPMPMAFYIIFANYTGKEALINATASIFSKEDNSEVANFNEIIGIKPYPTTGFYGTMNLNWETKDANKGEYILKYRAVKPDGTVLEGENSFVIGEHKGKLLRVESKDIYKGDSFKISAIVSNEGNLNLPTKFNVVIKNKQGEEVFKDEKQVTINPANEEAIDIEWQTDDALVGEYSAEYKVQMGDEVVADTAHFKVLSSYELHIAIVSILIILFIIFIMVAKKRKINEKFN